MDFQNHINKLNNHFSVHKSSIKFFMFPNQTSVAAANITKSFLLQLFQFQFTLILVQTFTNQTKFFFTN